MHVASGAIGTYRTFSFSRLISCFFPCGRIPSYRGRRVQLPFVHGASQPCYTQLCFSRYKLFPVESATPSPIVRGPACSGQKLFMPVLALRLCSYHASHDSQAAGTTLLLHRPSFDEPTLTLFTLARPIRQLSAQGIRQQHSREHGRSIAEVLTGRRGEPHSTAYILANLDAVGSELLRNSVGFWCSSDWRQLPGPDFLEILE